MTRVSYAQNYEDVMLARALREVVKGFYIDVGAQDPSNDSVTKAFYEAGWRGINLEPSSHWFAALERERPHDVNLRVAASDRQGTLRFFDVEGAGLSTTTPEYARRHLDAGFTVVESIVPCMTLDEICAANAVDVVHFMKVDCEGAEAAALRGISLENVRPWIIVVEAMEPQSERPDYGVWEPKPNYEAWERLLTGRGYHLTYDDGLNRFYVADEQARLDRAFAYPPNVFDDFVRAPEAALRQALESTTIELAEQSRLLGTVDYLRSENERREAALVEHRRLLEDARGQNSVERAQWQEAIGCLRGENERLRRESESRAADLAAANEEVGRLHHEVAHRSAEIERLAEAIRSIHASRSWRLGAPARACGRAVRKCRGWLATGAYWFLRGPARLARPGLRHAAQWRWLRRPIVRIVGAESALTAHSRLFLFGAPPERAQPSPDAVALPALGRQGLRVHARVLAALGSGRPDDDGRGA